MSDELSAPLRRVLRLVGDDVMELLTTELSRSDLTTLLLEVMRRRAQAVSPATVRRNHERDRFVGPGTGSVRSLRRAEDLVIDELPADFETLQLSPVVPLGAHSSVAPVDQNRVVSTIRGTEVAADPTLGLALEAAVRRRALLATASRSTTEVKLAAVQRVLRAQPFDGPMSFSHFSLAGFVTAGRDTGNQAFERKAAAEHASLVVAVLRAAGAAVRVELTDYTGGGRRPIVDAVTSAVGDAAEVVLVPDRTEGSGYYEGFRMVFVVRQDDAEFDLADGGPVDWARRLVGSNKERLFTSGIGLDRLAGLLA